MEIQNFQDSIGDISRKFGGRLRELRLERNLSQSQMAEKLLVGKSTYANWEQGRREPSLYYLIMLSKIWKISMDNLFNFV